MQQLKIEQLEIQTQISKNLFEHVEEDYYKPVSEVNFWSNSYIEYDSNGDKNKTLSTEEYLNKIRP